MIGGVSVRRAGLDAGSENEGSRVIASLLALAPQRVQYTMSLPNVSSEHTAAPLFGMVGVAVLARQLPCFCKRIISPPETMRVHPRLSAMCGELICHSIK